MQKKEYIKYINYYMASSASRDKPAYGEQGHSTEFIICDKCPAYVLATKISTAKVIVSMNRDNKL